MTHTLFSYLEGEVVLYADEVYRSRLTAIAVENGINARISDDALNGGVTVRLSPKNAKKMASALDKTDIIVYIISVCSFKHSLFSHCKRIGLLVGAFLFFMLLSLSTLFVFKVEVIGSELIAEADVKRELAEFGIKPGARLSDIDRTETANRFLQLHSELSWASVSIKGTTVRLEVKEKADAPPLEDEKADFLVAGFDGVVKSVLVYSGKPAVVVNSVVKKGDLLISGYISGNGLQYTDAPLLRYEGASGSVIAEVSASFSARACFTEQYSVSKSSEKCGIVVEILGKSFKFGKTSEEDGYFLTSEKNLTLWDKLELPITVRECRKISETSNTEYFTEEQATALAQKRAYEMLDFELAGASLCEIKTNTVKDGDGVSVIVEYVCLRDIAVPKKSGNTATD